MLGVEDKLLCWGHKGPHSLCLVRGVNCSLSLLLRSECDIAEAARAFGVGVQHDNLFRHYVSLGNACECRLERGVPLRRWCRTR